VFKLHPPPSTTLRNLQAKLRETKVWFKLFGILVKEKGKVNALESPEVSVSKNVSVLF
jgi:hypothetical protein